MFMTDDFNVFKEDLLLMITLQDFLKKKMNSFNQNLSTILSFAVNFNTN